MNGVLCVVNFAVVLCFLATAHSDVRIKYPAKFKDATLSDFKGDGTYFRGY